VQASTTVLPTVIAAIDKWLEHVMEKVGYTSMMVSIDNFDIISDEGIINFLNSMRDILIARKNIWWIIIGQKGLFSLIENNASRVSEMITGKPITLEPMTGIEVKKMINVRYENLKMSKKVEKIVPDDIITTLYEASGGETRYILKRTTDMIFSFMTEYPSEKKIPFSVAQRMLIIDAEKRIVGAGLTKRKQTLLKIMAEQGKFQHKEFKKYKLKSMQAFNNYIEEFVKLGFVIKKEITGREVYYRTSGDVSYYYTKNVDRIVDIESNKKKSKN